MQCPVQTFLDVDTWHQNCYDSYSTGRESQEPFQLKQANSSVQFQQCSLPWVYQTSEELNSSPKWGHHAWYGGGGYAADLGYEAHTAYTVINHLQLGKWIDRQTRAVIVEFNFFNPAISVLGVCSFFFEFLQTGQATPLMHIDLISLHNTDSILQMFQGLCLVIFIGMVFLKSGQTVMALLQQGSRYLRSGWCWLDLGHLATSISLLLCSFIKSYQISKSMQKLRHNIFATVNFQTAVLWGNIENSFLSVVIFLTTIKILQLTYFNMYTRVFAQALRIWVREFFSFLMVLCVPFFAFLLSGMLLFGTRNKRYSSVWPAFSYQLEIVLGRVKARPIQEFIEAHSVLGRLFVSTLLVIITVILMNLFVSSLDDAVSDAKSTVQMNTEQESSETQIPNRRNEQHEAKNVDLSLTSAFYDQISNQLRTIDLIRNLPQAYVIDKKLIEVLKRMDAHTDGEQCYPLQKGHMFETVVEKRRKLSTILEE